MARPGGRGTLRVHLNSRLVGHLNRAASGAIDFGYDPAWLGWENAFPISLSLPLREQRYIGAAVGAVFDNLLPDHAEVRRRLAARRGAEGPDAFSLLSVIGRDCVGALQFLPGGEAPGPAGAIDARPVGEAEIAALVADLSATPLGLGADGGFRISLAGAQEKTALLRRDGRWHVPHGTTATTHILKPAIGRREDGIDLGLSVENEHFCMTLLGALGLPVAATAIERFGGRAVLVVERFDRVWTADGRLLRLPQEDFCQALSVPPTRKYESDGGPGVPALMEVLRASDDPSRDQAALMRALVVFWLLAATDGHAKNLSLAPHPGGFAMTPLYDVMSAEPAFAAGQIRRNKLRLAMALGTGRHYGVNEIMPRHFLQTARACGMGARVMGAILDEIRDTGAAALDRARAAMPSDFPEPLAETIAAGFLRRARRIGRE